MILIGQYDSPFVRRVGVALTLYGLDFEHRPWSTFGDGDQLAAINPLRRVPTMILDDGEVLIESGAILDYLDERVGPSRALCPPAGVARRRVLRDSALATGLADKAVALFYERALHAHTSEAWTARCHTQIGAVLDVLEVARATPRDRLTHAEIALACALRFTRDAHPDLFDPAIWPGLAAFSAAREAEPAFQTISQAFIPPS
jgi:glutathione S-transferase